LIIAWKAFTKRDSDRQST